MANRLWGQEGMTFLEPFLDAMVEHFGAPLVAADFADDPDAAREEINGWVGETTEDRIPELFPDGTIDDTTRTGARERHAPRRPLGVRLRPGGDGRGRVHPGRRLHGPGADDALQRVPAHGLRRRLGGGRAALRGGRAVDGRHRARRPRRLRGRLDGELLDEVVGADRGRGHPPHDPPFLVLHPRLAGRAAAGHGRDRRLRRRRLQPDDRGRRPVRRRGRARGLHRSGRGGHGGRRRHRCRDGGSHGPTSTSTGPSCSSSGTRPPTPRSSWAASSTRRRSQSTDGRCPRRGDISGAHGRGADAKGAHREAKETCRNGRPDHPRRARPTARDAGHDRGVEGLGRWSPDRPTVRVPPEHRDLVAVRLDLQGPACVLQVGRDGGVRVLPRPPRVGSLPAGHRSNRARGHPAQSGSPAGAEALGRGHDPGDEQRHLRRHLLGAPRLRLHR